ncbi:hypothetical protein P171DRAFT_454379 [Karstenula rhodostoma CBS 690.94]|uniref:Uncharacterized protein n=1 Tax=Karstenula rhodostoma CBS 690.94 TaxID=1392251 RepID=A0A9P4PN33_9PLEO|nr:hypothetical protein P171DRAFT_454379 [Karstenula rhodostoma CBS 690.94]
MNPEHRKIELQSPADLAHLTTRLRTLARQKLDLHLPAQPPTTTPDDLRAHVEALVDAFVARLLAGMRQNICINGVDVVPRGAVDENGDLVPGAAEEEGGEVVMEEFEAFDEGLRKKVGKLGERRDGLVKGVSGYRRETGRGLPETRARLERAGEVVGYLEGKREG